MNDLTCIVRRRASVLRGLSSDTVICGQAVVERYLRCGYEFDWPATDAARAKDPLAALAPPPEAPANRQEAGEVEREAPWRDQRAVDAALDAEWATDAGGDAPAVGPSYSIREVMEAFGPLSTREIENAMATALKAAHSPADYSEEIIYDRDGPR